MDSMVAFNGYYFLLAVSFAVWYWT